MPENTTDDVRALYEAFPYPNLSSSDRLIQDVANLVAFVFPGESLAGKRILDAGCGTGHRLLALAKAFPGASFVGVDVADTALETARGLAHNHAYS